MKTTALLVLVGAGLTVMGEVFTLDQRAEAVQAESENHHIVIPNPAELDPASAEATYQSIRENMASQYANSGDPLAWSYQNWKRLNRAPYRSKAHGGLFVNNYASAGAAAAYAKRDRSASFAVGSMIVKDSFMVTTTGTVLAGPLYIVEKLPPGWAPNAGDWRFLVIKSDGTLVGLGQDEEKTRFCVTCHTKKNGTNAPFFYVPRGNEAATP